MAKQSFVRRAVQSFVPVRAGYRYVVFASARNGLRSTIGRMRGTAQSPVRTVAAAEIAGADYRTVYPAEHFRLDRPEALSDADWKALRIRHVDWVPESFVLGIANGSVNGEEGWVKTDSGEFIDDLWAEQGFPARSCIPSHLVRTVHPRQRLAGTTVCLTTPWLPNYYHWTLQAVPRFHLVSKVIDPRHVDHWIIPLRSEPYMDDWLDLLGIPARKRVNASDGAVACERLLAPSIPCPNRWIPRWVAEFLRAVALANFAPEAGARRIFVMRDGSEKRRILNQAELDELLREHGIDSVSLQGRSVAEQVALFASAELVVSVLGAALTNLVYCRPRTRVIEILPANLTFPVYLKLSATLGLDHAVSVGLEPRVPFPFYRTDSSADVVANIAHLRKLLESA
jgi:capsular polysaccharide biosynthesis protein